MTRDDDPITSADDELRTTWLPASELHCLWHARRIADYLRRVDGVVETVLEPGSDTVVVRYDPARTAEAAITAAVECRPSRTVRRSTRSRPDGRSPGCRCRCRNRSGQTGR